jgi:ketosteroid isomerase-like protein
MRAMEDRMHPVRDLFRFLASIGPLADSLHPDFEVHDHDVPDAEPFRGWQGLLEWVSLSGEAWESVRLEPEEFQERGDKVVVVARLWARGGGSGVEVTRQDGAVCTLRDGKLARVDYYGSKNQALAAAGL